MASKKAVTVKNLESLGAARLARLLMEFAHTDAAVKRRLRIELAETDGPEAVAQEMRRRLVAIEHAQSFVDWRRSSALTTDLDQQHKTIVAKIAPRDPALALDLLWRFMALAPLLYERCDDSNDRISDAFTEGCADLFDVAVEMKVDAITLNEYRIDSPLRLMPPSI